ncbi:MAG: ATP-binding protein [Paludibacteraceae bacterium]|nr:ATP-binding protein [Paludibacteraceae bacterium]
MANVLYKKRIADLIIERRLQGKGAVLIEGPKWCGKTTTAKQYAQSLLDLGDSTILSNAQISLQVNPKSLLVGDVPRLIDEWQTIPSLWDMIRSEVDRRQDVGQFILTGSSVPIEQEKIVHSGTGRIGRITMRPMSLWESGESNGGVSLNDLFEGKKIDIQNSDLTLEDIAYLICRGGWPKATLLNKNIALDEAFDYYEAIYKTDIHRVDNVRRNSERTRLLLRSYARNQGSSVSLNLLANDIKNNDNVSITYETVSDYIDALKKLFVIEDMPAWNPNLRSKSAIQTSDTRYFIDPSIAVNALSIGSSDLMNDLQTFGLFFESMAVRDLRVYADALQGNIFHFRNSAGLECDAVLHRRNGTYGLIEIKLGGANLIDQGAKTLLNLVNKIDGEKMPMPSFLMVLTAIGDYSYQRPNDGVWVVPIGCLKP